MDETWESQSSFQAAADPEPSSSRASSTSEDNFQFIDVSQDASRNRTIARSHVMKNIRKEKKKHLDTTGSDKQKPQVWHDQIVDLLQYTNRGPPNRTIYTASRNIYSEGFTSAMAKNFASGLGSPSVLLKTDISPMPLFTKRWSPLVHQTIDHFLKVIWPLYWPASSPDELSPMAIEWWTLFRSSPMLFHASTHAAAAHLDSLRSSTTLTHSTEALAHKTEAIKLINQALSDMQTSGSEPEDVLILSILAMTSEPRDDEVEGALGDQAQCPAPICPFKPTLMPIHWQKHFARVNNAHSHQEALYMLVQMKGGIEGIKSVCLSKSLMHHDLRAAAVEMHHPRLTFHEPQAIAALAEDPTNNVLMIPPDDHRGTSLLGLVEHGMTDIGLQVLLDLQEITVIIEAYCTGTLQNPSVISISSRRNRITHALLALPTRDEVSWMPLDQSAVYESCRLASLIYVCSIVFPIPPFVGVVKRMMENLVQTIDAMNQEIVSGPAIHMFIWAIAVAGCCAEGQPTRPWYVHRLKGLLVIAGIDRWAGLKALLESFLWMGYAMNDVAFTLWEEIADLKVQ